jgi:hypothetical protein
MLGVDYGSHYLNKNLMHAKIELIFFLLSAFLSSTNYKLMFP